MSGWWHRTSVLAQLVAAGLVLFGARSAAQGRPWRKVAIGERLPGLTLPGIDGRSRRVGPARGKALVLLYVRADQQRSLEAVKHLRGLFAKYRKRGLEVLVVASARDAGREKARRSLRGLPFPVLVDADDRLRGAAGLFVYPTTGLFDAKNTLRHEYSGCRPDYPMEIERQARDLLGLAPRAAPSRETRAEGDLARQRQQRMKDVMRQLELRRARRRFEAGRALLAEQTLAMVLGLYRKWSDALPPEAGPLAGVAQQVRQGGEARQRAIETLTGLTKKARHAAARLWLGRALALEGKTAAAEAVLSQCVGQADLQGQCAFELAGLVARTDPKRAVALCRRGYALAFPDDGAGDQPGSMKP